MFTEHLTRARHDAGAGIQGCTRGSVPNPDRGFQKDFREDVISELYVEGGVEIHPMDKAQTGNPGTGHRMCSSPRHLLCARHCPRG